MNTIATKPHRGLGYSHIVIGVLLVLALLMVFTTGIAFAGEPAPAPTLGPQVPPESVGGPFMRAANWGLFGLNIVFFVLLIIGAFIAATGNVDRKGSKMAGWSLAGLMLISGIGAFTNMFPQVTSALLG